MRLIPGSALLIGLLLGGCFGAPNPSLGEVLNLAASEEARGNHASAIALYTRAIQMRPESAELYCNRGCAKGNEGDFEGEIADETRALELDPRFATAYCNRGCARGSKGDLEGEISDETAALTMQPDFAGAYRNRAWARRKKGDERGALVDEATAARLTTHTIVRNASPTVSASPHPSSKRP